MTKGNSARVVKKANSILVLEYIRVSGPVTRENISSAASLSRPTVTAVIKDLIDKEIIEEAGLAESTGGRASVTYRISQKKNILIGIDLEFPEARLVLADLSLNVIYRCGWMYKMDADRETVISTIIDKIMHSIKECDLCSKDVFAIGLGLPGIVDINRQVSVNIERMGDWHDVAIAEIIKEKTGIDTYISNDVHLMGLAERKLYHNDMNDDLMYIGFRSGIGMAVFIDGRLYNGRSGNAGFLGHMTVDPSGPKCSCGNRGCLELFAGELALKEKYLRQKKDIDKSVYDAAPGRIFELLGKDEASRVILEEAGRYLGIGIANAFKLFDIPKVIIGGIKGDSMKIILGSARNMMEECGISGTAEEPVIMSGKLQKDLIPIGGCLLVLEKFHDKPKLNLSVK